MQVRPWGAGWCVTNWYGSLRATLGVIITLDNITIQPTPPPPPPPQQHIIASHSLETVDN